MTEAVLDGREALARHDWEEAFQTLSGADLAGGLDADDLERLADAAWWSGRPDDAVAAFERAYSRYLQDGDDVHAAAMAIRLAERAVRSLASPVAQGWMARAEHLLEGKPESAVHAWYEFMRTAESLLFRNDPNQAIAHADRAVEIGKRQHDSDVQAIAMSFKGAALLRLGRIDEGRSLLDEAAAMATSGALEAKTACDVYCFTISACREMSDFQRAGEWTERAESYMHREAINGYPGVCRVHRAELKRLRGQWAEAEDEARAACDELEQFRLLDVLGVAYNEIGEVRLHVGDLAAAEEAFSRAYEYGYDPQPGLALMLAARGEVEEAARSLTRSLDEGSGGQPDGTSVTWRAQLLPARVEIALLANDLPTARVSTEELEEIARSHDTPIWQAAAATARGSLDLAEGDVDEAIAALNRAWRQWQELDLPYEAAQARTSLGSARQAGGDGSGAKLEYRAALSAFRKLGAVPDVRRLEQLLGEAPGTRDGERVTMTFMFTDVVRSTELIVAMGDRAWDDLLRWHDRTLRSVFSRHGGEVVSHTGDGFFVAFSNPERAVECAVAVQQTLERHRQEHGFAPWVRIGIHAAEATREGDNYTGQGVHLAARVAGVAKRDEIVVSATTAELLVPGAHSLSEPQPVEVQGIADPVSVRVLHWAG